MKGSDYGENLRGMAFWGARVLPVAQWNQVLLVPRNGNTWNAGEH